MSRTVVLFSALWCSLAWSQVGARDAGLPRPPILPRTVFTTPNVLAPTLAPKSGALAWLELDDTNRLQVFVRRGASAERTALAVQPRGVRSLRWETDTRLTAETSSLDGGLEQLAFTASDDTFASWSVESSAPPTLMKDARLAQVSAGTAVRWYVDTSASVRAVLLTAPDGATEVRVRDSVKTPWRTLVRAGPEELVAPLDFSLDGKSLYLATTINGDNVRLVEKSLMTGGERVMLKSAESDLSGVLFHQPKRAPFAAQANQNGRLSWTVLDYAVFSDVDTITQKLKGNWVFESADVNNERWVIRSASEAMPEQFFLWERAAKRLSPLFNALSVPPEQLAQGTWLTIPLRNGLQAPALLTLPTGVDVRALPLVVMVQDAPWLRWRGGFEPRAQFFANRGFAVLQVHTRGSAGFGKRFASVDASQFTAAATDDLDDVLAWVKKSEAFDASRVTLMGRGVGDVVIRTALSRVAGAVRCVVLTPVELDPLEVASLARWRTDPTFAFSAARWSRRALPVQLPAPAGVIVDRQAGEPSGLLSEDAEAAWLRCLANQ